MINGRTVKGIAGALLICGLISLGSAAVEASEPGTAVTLELDATGVPSVPVVVFSLAGLQTMQTTDVGRATFSQIETGPFLAFAIFRISGQTQLVASAQNRNGMASGLIIFSQLGSGSVQFAGPNTQGTFSVVSGLANLFIMGWLR